MLASPGMCLALLAFSKFWAKSLIVTLLVVCPHSSGFCYVRVKRAAFLHISTENAEYFSSASPLAHSRFFGQLGYLLPWCRLVFFTGFFIDLFKDLGEECAFFYRTWKFSWSCNNFGNVFLGGGEWWRSKCNLFSIFLESMVLAALKFGDAVNVPALNWN